MAESNPEGLLILDVDGVLTLRSIPTFDKMFMEILDYVDSKIDRNDAKELIQALWGRPLGSIVAELLEEEPEKIDEGLRIFRIIYSQDYLKSVKPIPNAAGILGNLAAKHTLALNTAASRDVLFNQLIPGLNIPRELFINTNIVTAESLPYKELSKPDPFTVNLLMVNNGATPDNTLVVGDDRTDVDSALRAGVEPIMTLTGNLTEGAAEAIADELGINKRNIIEDISQLESLVDLIFYERKIGKTAIATLLN